MKVPEIVDKIRALMKAKKITQTEIAEKLGVSQNMISLYLSAKSPGIDKIFSILEVLEITPAEFFKEDGTTTTTQTTAICPYCGRPLKISIQ